MSTSNVSVERQTSTLPPNANSVCQTLGYCEAYTLLSNVVVICQRQTSTLKVNFCAKLYRQRRASTLPTNANSIRKCQ